MLELIVETPGTTVPATGQAVATGSTTPPQLPNVGVPDQIFFSPATISALRLGSLQDFRTRLLRDIPLTVTNETGSVVVSWDAIDEFGYGSTLSDAIADFRETIIELFDKLSEEEENLSSDLVAVLQKLRSYMTAAREISVSRA